MTGVSALQQLMVLLDNQTRWNSQYLSISQALKVKERIILFQSRYVDILKDDIITEHDWTRLQELKDGLWPFLLATNKIQGHQGSLWQWLPYLEGLDRKLEKEVDKYEQSGTFSWLAAPSHAAWKKTQEYYEATDTAYHLYAAATIFNPEQRMQYFNRHWNTPALERHKKRLLPAIKKEWTQFYKPKEKMLQQPQNDDPPDFLDEQLGQVPIPINSKDPLAEYAMGAPDKLQDSNTEAYFAWWDKHGHPQLRQMAWDSLAIPATSCDLERVFSSAGQLVDCTLNRMTDKTLEMRECLRHWLKSGFIELRAI